MLSNTRCFMKIHFVFSSASVILFWIDLELHTCDSSIILLTMKRTYFEGRPPWYDTTGSLKNPYVIGIAGGSASGKTSVCQYPFFTVLAYSDAFANNKRIKANIKVDAAQLS